MMKLACAAVSTLMLCSTLHAAEQAVSFAVNGEQVAATLNLPDGIDHPPVVLMLPGLARPRDGAVLGETKEGLFARAARQWAIGGVATLRIDFRGSGDSGGDFADTTLFGQVDDGLAALDWLAASGLVDAGRMALVGHEMGGAVGAVVAGRTSHELDAVALWRPAANPAAAVIFMLGEDKVRAGLASGGEPVQAVLPSGKAVTLKTGFFTSLFGLSPAAEIAAYDDPLLVAVARRDEVVFPQPESVQVLLDFHRGDGELWVRDVAADFDAGAGPGVVDELIATTGEYLLKRFD